MDSFTVESVEKKLEKIKNQRAMYEEVLTIDDRDAFALQKYIELSIELGDLEGGASQVSRFISIYPSNPKAFLLDLKIKKSGASLIVRTLRQLKRYALKREIKLL